MVSILQLWQVFSYLITMLSVYTAVGLFVQKMPVRSGFLWRAAVFGVLHLFIFAYLLLNASRVSDVSYSAGQWGSISTMLTLAAFYVALPLLVLFFFESPLWAAALCAAAGYTLQNLASSITELMRMIAGFPPNMGSSPPDTLSSLVGYIVVYLLCNELFIRRAAQVGLGHGSRRNMVALVAVMVVVIFFDTQVKAVALGGTPYEVALSLRVIHVVTCAFTLYAEYQIIYVGRLAAEVAAERSMREGEERLWESSRQNMDAINARVHDMRHQIARTLANSEADIDRETLAQVAREINIYDTGVRTGNAVLDTILSERSLVYRRNGVQLAIIADGAAVAKINDADLYAIMENLIDAAAQMSIQVADTERRRISIQVKEAAGMAAIHVACLVPDNFEMPRFEELRAIIKRIDGTFSASLRDQELSLDVLLPQ